MRKGSAVSLTDPDAHRDKTADWLEVFHARRREALQRLVTAELLELQRTNTEPETVERLAELHLVMNYVRLLPAVGKSYVYAEEPYRRYRLGRLTGRGVPAEIVDERVFETERDAQHAVFCMRLQDNGFDLPEQA